MTILQSIWLGVIEGITEFLPISSTFHLIWSFRILGIEETEFVKLYGVVIQAGAVVAVLGMYFLELLKNVRLVLKIFISFLPTAIIGFVLYDFVKNIFFESDFFIIFAFTIVGVLFILTEIILKDKIPKNTKTTNELSFKEAFYIGIVQSVALIPGVSRSGAILVSMLYLGFKRQEGAKYSFMLSLPTIFAASSLDIYQSKDLLISSPHNLMYLLIGFFTAIITAFLSIKWLIKFLGNHSLVAFGWYRVIFGILLLIFTVFQMM